jgi:hypothetical protein
MATFQVEKEKIMGKSGLALSVFMENDVLLTASFITNERGWVRKQHLTPGMV